MSAKLLKSFAIEGSVVVTIVWSKAAKNRVMVIPRKTKTRRMRVKGTLGPKSWNVGASGAVACVGGDAAGAASRSVEELDSVFSASVSSKSASPLKLVCTTVECDWLSISSEFMTVCHLKMGTKKSGEGRGGIGKMRTEDEEKS